MANLLYGSERLISTHRHWRYSQYFESTGTRKAISDAGTGRLVRLIPDSDDPRSEAHAIKALFNHRLPDDCGAARKEWLDIVEAQHSIWDNISSPKKELIRSFLITVNLEIGKRLRPSSRFDFSRASIGNLFLTG